MDKKEILDILDNAKDDSGAVPMRLVRQALDKLSAIQPISSAQPERVWHPVEKPPAHHKDVIVRGVEAIGNVTVHKVMQWDVDTWRPTDYAPSIMWTEWSEI